MKSALKHFSKALLIGCALITAVACSNKQQSVPGDYVIKGTVEGLDDGTVLTLTPLTHDPNVQPLAETKVEDGEFVFAGNVTDTICANIQVKGAYGKLSVMLEKGTMKLKAKANRDKTTDEESYRWTAEVSGSPLTEQLRKFDERYDSLYIFYDDLIANHGEIMKKMKTMSREEMDAFRNTDEYKKTVDAQKFFFGRVEVTILNLVTENANTFWGPLLALKYFEGFAPDQHSLYDVLEDDVKASYYGRMMEKYMPKGAHTDADSTDTAHKH